MTPGRRPAPAKAKQDVDITTYDINTYWEKITSKKVRNHNFKTTDGAKRKLVERHFQKEREAAAASSFKKTANTDKFYKNLKKALKESHSAAEELIRTSLEYRLLATGEGVKLTKKETGLKGRWHTGHTRLAVTDGKVDDADLEWKILLGQAHLFSIKQSTKPDAGFGLFAGRDYEQDEFIGIYYAPPAAGQSQYKKRKNEQYCLQGQDGKLFMPDCNTIYMGFHFVNDPCHNDPGNQEKMEEVNVTIQPNLHVEVTKDIAKGDEIFWNYGLEDV